ncbi:MAG: MBL fold metallo-hydrolase, partial [Calditrichaeota bacterium]
MAIDSGEFRITQVAGKIWSVGTAFGEVYVYCYVIDTDDGLILYDCGLKKTATAIFDLCKQLGRGPEDIRVVVLSHSHHDHIGALSAIAEAAAATTIAHKRAEPWLIDHERQYRELFGRWEAYLPLGPAFSDFFFDNLGRPWIPDRLLDTFPAQVERLASATIIETPGHSSDSVSLWMEYLGLLICGDA